MSEAKMSENEMWKADVMDARKRTERDYDHYAMPIEIIFWADAELTRLRADNERLQKIADENYSDLLDQMDERWGNAPEIGRPEINAFLETRIVHRPTMSLRAMIAERDALLKAKAAVEGENERVTLAAGIVVSQKEELQRRIRELEAQLCRAREAWSKGDVVGVRSALTTSDPPYSAPCPHAAFVARVEDVEGLGKIIDATANAGSFELYERECKNIARAVRDYLRGGGG